MGEETKSVNGKDESTAAATVLSAEEKADDRMPKDRGGAHKKLSAIDAWENTKRAAVEAELKQIEAAEEKRATIEENRSKDSLNAEEMAAKYRTTATIPKKSCACFTF
ncbi:hypothetical protein SASPL_140782 [Salvia splendens]|uniref:Remorin n=1 Tax=Salvia splendens TaxID=180675 RepID=A0A8X8WR25_SALSN|nr:hypothetical protein SASPL_140782 [Salvia splendens]